MECAICWHEISDESDGRSYKSLDCCPSIKYHEDCIINWLKSDQNYSCPFCRKTNDIYKCLISFSNDEPNRLIENFVETTNEMTENIENSQSSYKQMTHVIMSFMIFVIISVTVVKICII